MAVKELTISRLGPKGDGIHEDGKGRIYVERALPGDRLKGRVRRDEEELFRADIVEIVEPSPFRQSAPCPHYERCGGCTVQHLKEAYYRAWKTELVKEAFAKVGLRPMQWHEPVFVGANNRRRATFTAFRHKGCIVMGYYRRRSRLITDIDSCLIANPKLLALRDRIKPHLERLLPEGKPVDIFLQLVGDAVDMVFTGPIGRHGKPDMQVQEAITKLIDATRVTRVSWRANERDEMKVLASQGSILAAFGELKVNLPPAAFLQPTPEGEKALVAAVMEALPEEGKFADLFSGCGTFSGPMLARGPVDAYESVPSAVQALGKAATGSKLKVFRRDLYKNPLRREELNRYDAVVFDPPRGGALAQATRLAEAKAHTLVGVSCNPATFARDARTLCDGGYWLTSLRVVDQFLWSHHVEVVGVFSRQKRVRRFRRP